MSKPRRQLSPEQLERLRQDLKERTKNSDGKPLRPIFEALAKKHGSTRGAVEQQYYNNVRSKAGPKGKAAKATARANGSKKGGKRQKAGRPAGATVEVGTQIGTGTLTQVWRRMREQEKVAARESRRAQKLREIAVRMERRVKAARRDATRAAASAENDARNLLAKARKV